MVTSLVPVRDRHVVEPEVVRAARLARNVTQAELAQAMDVTVMTVSRRETGASPTTWEIWLGLTHALNLPSTWRPGDPVPLAEPVSGEVEPT